MATQTGMDDDSTIEWFNAEWFNAEAARLNTEVARLKTRQMEELEKDRRFWIAKVDQLVQKLRKVTEERDAAVADKPDLALAKSKRYR